jgi:hypothetical protein
LACRPVTPGWPASLQMLITIIKCWSSTIVPPGRASSQYLRQVPAGCAIRRLDRDLVLRTEWGPADVAFFGGLDGWEKTCFGYALMRGDEILSEASVGPAALGCYEPGVFTQIPFPPAPFPLEAPGEAYR